jgi:hypothetical protein
VDKGLLIVEAEHPGWIQLLQMHQSSILEAVARRFPELGLRGIVFRLAGHGGAPRTPAPSAKETGLEKEAATALEAGDSASASEIEKTQEIMSAAEDIEDPEFRALFSSLKKTMQGKG